MFDIELASDDGSGFVIAIIEDFQKVALALIRERSDGEVIDQQQIGSGEGAEEA